MKVCSDCNLEKSESEFAKNPHYKCKSCQNVYFKKYYKDKRLKHIQKVKYSKIKNKDWFADLKSKLKCSRCGFDHPAAIQFHHSDPSKKDFSLSQGVTMGYSRERILEEIAKCEVLCANCHFIEHWKNKLESFRSF